MRVANWETGSAIPSLLSTVERYSLTAAKSNCSANAALSFSTRRRAQASRAELDGEILEIRRRDVDRRLGSGFPDARPVLVRPCDVSRAQPAFGRFQKIVGMCRDHHAVAGRQIEGLAGGEVDARLGLVVARDFRAQDRVPGKIVAARGPPSARCCRSRPAPAGSGA